ncbi:MAG: hypothetical protein ABI597_04920 [Gammaproteobacteria bacterium]
MSDLQLELSTRGLGHGSIRSIMFADREGDLDMKTDDGKQTKSATVTKKK